MKFPFLASFFLFILLFTYKLRKAGKSEEQILKDFWQRERDANNVRKKSLDGLNYITIPFEKLPMETDQENEEIRHIHDVLQELSAEKIVNFTGISNTDLKLTYGTANITPLTRYDQNYTLLAGTVYKWGEFLYGDGFVSEAKQVLEFGLEIGTDVSGNYKLLAQIYKQEENEAGQKLLYEKAQELHSLMKKPVLKALDDIFHDAE